MSNIEENIPADFETVFKAGSIAKLFTAIEIMRLYEEGLVDLDAPIETYLQDFSINTRFNDSAPITIRNILAHRSGLPRNGNIPLWAWDNNFILEPISQTELMILGGSFDGETMYRSSENGYIYWQNRVFKPAENYPS